jgi:hypothetical protein
MADKKLINEAFIKAKKDLPVDEEYIETYPINQ